MSDPVKLELTLADRQSATWAKVEAYLNAKLAVQRAKNDGPHDPVTTATIRGTIKQLKELLGKPAE